MVQKIQYAENIGCAAESQSNQKKVYGGDDNAGDKKEI